MRRLEMAAGGWMVVAALALASPAPRAEQPDNDMPDNSAAFRKNPGLTLPSVSRAEEREHALEGVRELTGVVVQGTTNELWLRSGGVVVPFAVTRQTRVEGSPTGRGDVFQPGQEVRARFSIVAARENVAVELRAVPRSQARGPPGGGEGARGPENSGTRPPPLP